MNKSADWHLLFGLLALQNGLITRQQLVAAFAKWTSDKSSGIDELLVADGAISQDRCDVLKQLVELHVAAHDGDPERSLAVLVGSDLSAAKSELAQLEDSDLARSIAQLPEDQVPEDRIATLPPPTMGNATSEGGRFRIVRPLEGGAGGMGVISVAVDSELGRHVALKQIRPDQADRGAYRDKFKIEAEITGNLEHPGIVPIYGLGEDEFGEPYYAMRLVRGDNLSHAITAFHEGRQAGKTDYDSVEFRNLIDRLIDVAQAISYAHSRGVLHRDLKPGNVLVGKYGETLVIDWGLARLPVEDPKANEQQQVERIALDDPGTIKVKSGSLADRTIQGSVMGTLGYAPPEQIQGDVALVGRASDVYGLGAILYHILTGAMPIAVKGREAQEIMDDTVRGKIPPPSVHDRHIPKPLEAVCMKALARDPKDRYQSADELITEIERWKADLPVLARRESLSERAVRLARRHRSSAVASAAALTIIAIVATLAFFAVDHQRAIAEKSAHAERQAKNEQLRLVTLEREARADADHAYTQLVMQSAFSASERGDLSEAALWFAHAAGQQKSEDNHNSDEDRLRAAAWLAASPRPIAAFRHEGRAPYRLVLSDTGDYLLLTDATRRYVLWDVRRDRQVMLPTNDARIVALSADGKLCALSSTDGAIHIHSLSDMSRVVRFNTKETARAITFSPNSRLLAIASDTVHVWDTRADKMLEAGGMSSGLINHVAFDARSQSVLACDAEGWISVWNVKEDRLERNQALVNVSHVTDTGAHGESSVEPIINSYSVVVRDYDNALSAYSLATGKLIWRSSPRWRIASVGQSHAGDKLVLAGNEAQIWRIGDRTPERTIVGYRDKMFMATALSGDGELLVSGGLDSEVNMWRWTDRNLLRTRIQHHGHISKVTVAIRRPELIATVQSDGLVRVWKMAFPQPAHTIPMSAPAAVQVITSADRRYAMPGGSLHWERGLREAPVFDALTGQIAGPPLRPGGMINGSALSPDGAYAVTLSSLPENAHLTSYLDIDWENKPGIVTVWDSTTGQQKGQAWTTPSEPVDAEYLPHGRELAIVCAGGQILIVNSESGKVLREMNHGGQAILNWTAPKRRVVASRTGDRIATLGLGRTVKVWNPQDGRLLCAGTHGDWITDAEFSADGRWLATASMDNTARVWDCLAGKEVARLQHPDWVFGVTFEMDGNRLLIACRDYTARIWNWQDGVEELVLPHPDQVKDVAFAGGGSVIATITLDGYAHFWSRSNGKLLTPPSKGFGGHTLAVTGKGSSIIASTDDLGTPAFHIFHIPSVKLATDAPSPNTLAAVAELFSGRRLGRGTTARLTSAEWMQKWESLDSSTIERVAGPERLDDVEVGIAENGRSSVLQLYETAMISLEEGSFDMAYTELQIARQLVEQTIELSPDSNAYYNLACLNSLLAEAESRRGGSDEAVSQAKQASADAFHKAIGLGFSDREHASADRDLDFVRQMSEFQEWFEMAE